MQAELMIRDMSASDWESVRWIYEVGIQTGNATFETQTPAWEQWDANHLPHCRFVAEMDGQIVGWIALSQVSRRQVYAGVTEHSVYIHPDFHRKGIGKALLEKLIHTSEEKGIWTIQTSIFPENEASIALHQTCGFRIVGRRERIAKRDGVWRDTVMMERRSKIIE